MEDISYIHYIVYAVIVIFMFAALFGVAFLFWGNKSVGKKIEDRGKIPFSDEPWETREDNKNKP